jgi:hypothetical protein
MARRMLPDPAVGPTKGHSGPRCGRLGTTRDRTPKTHKFVMYYSARQAENSNTQCISAAVSTNIKGPYLARPQPIACHTSQGEPLTQPGSKIAMASCMSLTRSTGTARATGQVR